MNDNKKIFIEGLRDGIPIGLAYFAVSFPLGIIAKSANISWLEGFFASVLTTASAGEYGVFSLMAINASYIEVAFITFIANARYILMSCALSQRFSEKTSYLHRFIVGFYIIDELFGVNINREGYINPIYSYGAILTSVPLWGLGTSLGIVLGSILSKRMISALSVALYGMFLAIIIPSAKKDKVVLISIIISFVISYLFAVMPYLQMIPSGIRIIILTIFISSIAAIVAPIKVDEGEA